MFYNTSLGRLPWYAHASLKTPFEDPVEKNGSWRKKYISFINCIAHVVSLKTLCEKLSRKNSRRKKSTTFNLLGYVFFRVFYSSWINIYLHNKCINFNILSNMICLICVILVVLITFEVDSIKLLPS
jgi:hypothetical protein